MKTHKYPGRAGRPFPFAIARSFFRHRCWTALNYLLESWLNAYRGQLLIYLQIRIRETSNIQEVWQIPDREFTILMDPMELDRKYGYSDEYFDGKLADPGPDMGTSDINLMWERQVKKGGVRNGYCPIQMRTLRHSCNNRLWLWLS